MVLRVIAVFATSILMVRPEGAHSKLSQKADLAPLLAWSALSGSADSAHYALLKPGYFAEDAKIGERRTLGRVGVDAVAARIA